MCRVAQQAGGQYVVALDFFVPSLSLSLFFIHILFTFKRTTNWRGSQ